MDRPTQDGNSSKAARPDLPSEAAGFRIRVNGEERSVPAGTTVFGLLRQLALEPDRVAVELDRSIVHKPQWESTELRPEAVLEIVQFVGGG